MVAGFACPTLAPVFLLPGVSGTYSLLCGPIGAVGPNTKPKLVNQSMPSYWT